MNNVLTWDYNGWKQFTDDESTQTDWNTTLITKINIAAKKLKEDGYVLVVIPNHMRDILEKQIEMLDGWDKDVIEVNGMEIHVLNYQMPRNTIG